ncbi:A/G-specific adenine glycosylase [Geomicrobium sp. JCM 19039]|uniref:A/G-specific adenine glycosylase n=1 Tax=Geomicrobium sp. JCM 19039 TaxID=1460636 RepID=UPI00045F2387|nr:A/G-specific adenine glycosylase [Geomicrobium sp. JCM 19039]GAK13467.1 A/G-specific adenine glycosylase [Geomicrobium sp. JCM 19039]
MNEFNVGAFNNALLSWYEREKRTLPWREGRDPYHIWVSEIMLQQTRVDTVIPYYENFISKFPTVTELANADEEDVLKAWEGLGYYSRVKNLQSAVREVRTNYGGVVPNDPVEFEQLKGVGPYTKGAVMSIAYDLKVAAVDGNVMRVLARVFDIHEDISKQKTRKKFEEIVQQMLETAPPADFNQALMELGALVCKPRNPDCTVCPVATECRALQTGTVHELPVKAKKAKPRQSGIHSAILVDENDRVLIEKRPSTGLLADLWQFPSVEEEKSLSAFLEERYGLKPQLQKEEETFRHVFSHLIWTVTPFTGYIDERDIPYSSKEAMWVHKDELHRYSFPVVHQKIKKHFVGV